MVTRDEYRNHRDGTPRVSRFIQMQLPLWGILCGLGAFALFLIGLYVSQVKLVDAQARIQEDIATVKQDVRSYSVLPAQVETLKSRVDTMDRDHQRIGDDIRSLRTGRVR